MKILKFIVLLSCFLLLGASAPSDLVQAEREARRRVECLDRICPGDVVPKTDLTEVALKLNGQWFIGPRKYFSAARNGASFEWWHHKAHDPAVKRPPEMQVLALDGKGYDFSIEIFLRSNKNPPNTGGMYDLLLSAEKERRVISKTKIRPGLEVWRITDNLSGIGPGLWYIATQLKNEDGFPPVVYCRNDNPKFDRCTMGFRWRPEIYADIRFRGKLGSDWPEIYQEINRILQLVRKT